MNYPEGENIQLGDVIWLNGGTQVAKITSVIDNSIKAGEWGLDLEEQGIFFCVDLSKRSPSQDLFIPCQFFRDDGIGLLSNNDLQTLDILIDSIPPDLGETDHFSYSVGLKTNQNLNKTHWIVDVWTSDKGSIRTFVFEI